MTTYAVELAKEKEALVRPATDSAAMEVLFNKFPTNTRDELNQQESTIPHQRKKKADDDHKSQHRSKSDQDGNGAMVRATKEIL